MDPTETLSLLLDNLASAGDVRLTETARTQHRHRATDHAEALTEWLATDGFAPLVTRRTDLDRLPVYVVGGQH